MELSKIDVVLIKSKKQARQAVGVTEQIMPTSESESTRPFKVQNISTLTSIDTWKVKLKDDTQVIKEWTIDHLLEADSGTTFQGAETLIDFVAKGYDVAALSMNTGDEEQYQQQRQYNLHMFLSSLQDRLEGLLGTVIKFEYAYLGFTDTSCYDFRKDIERTAILGDSINDKGGLDSIMRQVNSTHDIWIKLQHPVETPSMLIVKLTNETKSTVGRFMFIDMLHPNPTATLDSTDTYQKLYTKLYDTIRLITGMTDRFGGHIDASHNFLLQNLLKFLCGHNKLTVFVHSDHKIDNENQSKEFIKCLDILTKLRSIPVKMIPNPSLPKSSQDYRNSVYIEKLEKQIHGLEGICSHLELNQEDLRGQLESEKIQNNELQSQIESTNLYERAGEKQIQYVKESMALLSIETTSYINALLREREVCRALIDIHHQDMIRKLTSKEHGHLKNKYKSNHQHN